MLYYLSKICSLVSSFKSYRFSTICPKTKAFGGTLSACRFLRCAFGSGSKRTSKST